MSRDGKATVISLGLHPTKKAQFYCHSCKQKFENHLEYSRLKVLNDNGSCATMRTYCYLCTQKHLNLDTSNYNMSGV